jgi:farnesyl-diphosphate farnesyltransferase
MLNGPDADRLLYPILKSVARSFYLTLIVLPRDIRAQMAVAYLLARAADTLADTDLLPQHVRRTYLARFRGWVLAPQVDRAWPQEMREALDLTAFPPHERRIFHYMKDYRELLERFSLQDQRLIQSVVAILIGGMEKDLSIFSSEDVREIRALKDLADLDRYVYDAAGCVGDFWTRMICAHRPSLRAWDVAAMGKIGIRFGKGLQFTNVLRDLPQDLRRGRCYIPEVLLSEAGLKPRDLLDPTVLPQFKPVLGRLLDLALQHLDQGWCYTMAIPRREVRLRLACIWPIWFAMQTLRRVSRAANLLDPRDTVKMTRSEIYRDMALSASVLPSNRLLTGYYGHLRKSVAC